MYVKLIIFKRFCIKFKVGLIIRPQLMKFELILILLYLKIKFYYFRTKLIYKNFNFIKPIALNSIIYRKFSIDMPV